MTDDDRFHHVLNVVFIFPGFEKKLFHVFKKNICFSNVSLHQWTP